MKPPKRIAAKPDADAPWIALTDEDFAVSETYYWYDGPLLFSFTHDGAMRLASAIDLDREDGAITYKVCSPSPEMLAAMANDEIDLRDVYQQGPFYDLVLGDEVLIRPSEQPMSEEDLPDPGVRLVTERDVSPTPV